MELFVTFLLAAVSLLAVSLERTYASVPPKELKRRARSGDELAAALYRAAAYGSNLKLVLWGLISLTSAVFFVYVSRNEPVWFALAASAGLVWLGFVWLPYKQVSGLTAKAAAKLAPVFEALMNYAAPLADLITRRLRMEQRHTGLYEKDDLLEILNRQARQTDNRIEQAELEIARNALTFGEKLIGDVMVPRRQVKTVSAEDDLGPVLMSELHDSGHSRFPVYDGQEDNLIGTLYLRDLVNAKTGGKVKDKMVARVQYLHEDQTLHHALQAILKTRWHLYVVVNSFEEYVGIIALEDVLENILGRQIVDEFDRYEDLKAIAGKKFNREPKPETAEVEVNEPLPEETEIDDHIIVD